MHSVSIHPRQYSTSAANFEEDDFKEGELSTPVSGNVPTHAQLEQIRDGSVWSSFPPPEEVNRMYQTVLYTNSSEDMVHSEVNRLQRRLQELRYDLQEGRVQYSPALVAILRAQFRNLQNFVAQNPLRKAYGNTQSFLTPPAIALPPFSLKPLKEQIDEFESDNFERYASENGYRKLQALIDTGLVEARDLYVLTSPQLEFLAKLLVEGGWLDGYSTPEQYVQRFEQLNEKGLAKAQMQIIIKAVRDPDEYGFGFITKIEEGTIRNGYYGVLGDHGDAFRGLADFVQQAHEELADEELADRAQESSVSSEQVDPSASSSSSVRAVNEAGGPSASSAFSPVRAVNEAGGPSASSASSSVHAVNEAGGPSASSASSSVHAVNEAGGPSASFASSPVRAVNEAGGPSASSASSPVRAVEAVYDSPVALFSNWVTTALTVLPIAARAAMAFRRGPGV